MQFPSKCPNCNASFEGFNPNESEDIVHGYLVERGRLDWDSDEPHRIEDTIMECSQCHTLFKLKWKLESISILTEKQL